ncbi:MAG: enoyl-CoA hydratase/isomerase family protein [Candidatus Desulfacyla sp.]
MEPDFETLQTRPVEGAIARILINKPEKLNALDTQVLSELCEAFALYDRDPDVRIIVLSGSGEKSFIAGADIEEMAGMGPLEFRAYTMKLRTLARVMTHTEKIVIGVVKGFAFGGGNILAMNCDFVFATEGSLFGQQEIDLGIIGGIPRLIYLVGARRAWDIVMTGRKVSAREAEEIGLITRCLPTEGFDEFVMDYARKLLKKSRIASKMAKALKGMSEKIDLESAYEYENELISLCFASADTKERLRSFAEKGRKR